jgi:hypothetical protein
MVASITRIKSALKFFIIVVPKYFNIATLSQDLVLGRLTDNKFEGMCKEVATA